jgi:hypothetical protein
MISTPLRHWLDGAPALDELSMTLRDVAGRGGRLLSAHKLRKDVYRIELESAHRRSSVVAKCMSPPVAHRNQLALESWLPAAGLDATAPRLVGVAAARAGRAVWHLYEDVGAVNLEDCAATRPEVEAAVHLIAALHARFAGHPVLAECRLWGEDHGAAFYDHSVNGAIAAVGAAAAALGACSRYGAAAARLAKRLRRLADERDRRVGALAQFGGPDTLLHGDLWLDNVLLVPEAPPTNGGGRAPHSIRLIDWDNVGPGSISYDLSTLAMRFAADDRRTIVTVYREAAAGYGFEVPPDEHLPALFATAEYARLANMAIWAALAVARDGSQWGVEELASIDEWLAAVPAAISG